MTIENASSKTVEKKRVPGSKPADCLGYVCLYYTGEPCYSWLELVGVEGESDDPNLTPIVEDSSYAEYAQVCTGGDEQVGVAFHPESPNGKASHAEVLSRSIKNGQREIVLGPTPLSR